MSKTHEGAMEKSVNKKLITLLLQIIYRSRQTVLQIVFGYPP